MAVAASTIITRAAVELHDTAETRWGSTEKLGYLNEAQRQIVLLKPDAYVVNDVYRLSAGTKQSIPDGSASFQNASAQTLKEGISIVKITRNMGTDGATAGNAINVIGQEELDLYNPGWHAESQAAAVKNYMVCDEDPKRFYVTPPNTGTGYIEAIYSAMPAAVAAVGNNISLNDEYQDPIRHYIMYLCYAKDEGISPINEDRAVKYWNLFVSSLGRTDLIRKMISPNTPKKNPSTQPTEIIQ